MYKLVHCLNMKKWMKKEKKDVKIAHKITVMKGEKGETLSDWQKSTPTVKIPVVKAKQTHPPALTDASKH